jgi:hypothetical protein
MKKIHFINLVILLPVLARAEGGLEGLSVLDFIRDIYYGLLVGGALGLICAIIYFFKKVSGLFYLTLISICLLIASYAFSFFMFSSDDHLLSQFMNPMRDQIFLLSLSSEFFLTLKAFIDSRTKLSAYFAVTTVSILFAFQLGEFLVVPMPPPLVMLVFFLILYTFLYVRKMIRLGHADVKKLMLKTSLICGLSLITVVFINILLVNIKTPSLASFDFNGFITLVLSVTVLGPVAASIVAVPTTFITLKKYG